MNNQMKNTGLIIKNGIWNGSGKLFSLVVLVVTLPITLQNLGSSQYGLVTLAQSIIGPMGFLTLSVRPAAVKYMAEELSRKNLQKVNFLFHNLLGVNILAGMVGAFILSLFANPIARVFSGLSPAEILIAVNCIYVVAATFFVDGLFNSFISIQEAIQNYKIVAMLNSFSTSGTMIIGTIIAVLGGNAYYYLFAGLLVKIILVGVAFLQGRSTFPELSIKPSLSWLILKKIFSYGVWLSFHGLGSLIFEHGSRILIGIFISVADAGLFSVVLGLFQKLHQLLNSVGEVLFPTFSSIEGEKNTGRTTKRLWDGYLISSWYFSLLAFFIYVSFFTISQPIINLWLGKEVIEIFSSVALPLSVVFMFHSTGIVRHSFMLGTGETRLIAFNGLLAATLSLGATAILLPTFGLIGASYSFFAILISGQITWYLLSRKYRKKIYSWGKVYSITFLPIFMGAVFVSIEAPLLKTIIDSIIGYQQLIVYVFIIIVNLFFVGLMDSVLMFQSKISLRKLFLDTFQLEETKK